MIRADARINRIEIGPRCGARSTFWNGHPPPEVRARLPVQRRSHRARDEKPPEPLGRRPDVGREGAQERRGFVRFRRNADLPGVSRVSTEENVPGAVRVTADYRPWPFPFSAGAGPLDDLPFP